MGNLGDHLKNVGNDGAVFSGDTVGIGNMGLRHHQYMAGSLGGDIIERKAQVVLIDLAARDLAGDDAAENTVFHSVFSFLILIRYCKV